MIKKYWKFGVALVVAVVIGLVIGVTRADAGGSMRVMAGADAGDVSEMVISGEVRLDPHRFVRVETDFSTGWTDGVYDKTLRLDNIGAYLMLTRDKVEFGCGGNTDVVVDGRSALVLDTSYGAWFGCLAETRW